MVGISSGAALAAALAVGRQLNSGVLVTVFPDGAEKYLSEKFWTSED
jgi:cysteine synthase